MERKMLKERKQGALETRSITHIHRELNEACGNHLYYLLGFGNEFN